uniref:transposase n=1 Tax=Paenirhodobacter populi TaxID=2306993 RepID=UPI0026CF83E4
MKLFVGLDVSLEKTAICVISEHGPMLRARLALRRELAGLERHVRQLIHEDPACLRLMSMSGAVIALTYRSAVDDPDRFISSKKVGPSACLTPSRNQSGERDIPGLRDSRGTRFQ